MTKQTAATDETLSEVRQVLGRVLQLGSIRTMSLGRTSALLGSMSEVDSMAVVQILTTLEEHFGISIPDDEISADAFATLGSLADLVQSRLD